MTSERLKVVGYVFVFLFGAAGWLGLGFVEYQKYKAEERAEIRVKQTEERAEIRAALQEFLYPLKRLLDNSRAIHETLTKDFELKRLEFLPYAVRSYFISLPASDFRKTAWKDLVGIILHNNDAAVEIINTKSGFVPSAELDSKLDDFIHHVKLFKTLWESAMSNDWTISPGSLPPPLSPPGPADLQTPVFPVGLDEAVAAEIRRRSGALKPE